MQAKLADYANPNPTSESSSICRHRQNHLSQFKPKRGGGVTGI
jgi:hypothetical protein